jgi:hypothetical protein
MLRLVLESLALVGAVIYGGLRLVPMQRDRLQKVSLFLIVAVIAMCVDPYSFGGTGGDSGRQSPIAWQVMIAAASVLALGATFVMLPRHPKSARLLQTGEFVLFCAANAAYMIRDGVAMRMVVGYESSPRPGIALALGLGCRVTCAVLFAMQVHAEATSLGRVESESASLLERL